MKEVFAYTGYIGNVRFYQPGYMDLSRVSYRYNDYSRMASIVVCTFRERISPDLVHAHFGYWPGYAGGIVGKILRKPILLTVHGSDIHQMTRPEYTLPMQRERVLTALRMCDRIIAVSYSLRQMLNELGYGQKTVVIPSGFVGGRFHVLERKMCCLRLGLPVDKKILLYVGNMLPVKGTDIAIEAFLHLCRERDDLIFVLVGDGELRPGLEDVVRGSGFSCRIRFKGWRSNDEVSTYLNAADVLVLPSRNEGRPAVVMEALSCGTPVVATRVGGIPELISNASLGELVEPENPDSLANAVCNALRRTWNREYLHEHVQQFSWEHIAPQIYRCYLELLGKEFGSP